MMAMTPEEVLASMQDPRGSCPCLHTTPCTTQCTCINAFMSAGCLRCCSYGSDEQRRAAAEHIARAIDSYEGNL